MDPRNQNREVETVAAPCVLPGVARGNIETVTQIAEEFARTQTRVDRLSGAVTRRAGSVTFVVSHVLIVAVWIAINTGSILGISPFDPFPFSLLGVIISFEAVLLSLFVLMNQKRQAQQAEHWAHLHLQIGILVEQEATKMLQLLTSISERLGLPTSHDAELQEMTKKTVVNHLAQELADTLEKTRAAEVALEE